MVEYSNGHGILIYQDFFVNGRYSVIFGAIVAILLGAWTHGNNGIATLSAQSAIAVGWSDARGTVTTDTGSGSLSTVLVPSAAVAPSAAQVIACTDGSGTAAVACRTDTVSASGTISKIKLGCTQGPTHCLSSVTAYKIYFAQNTAGGNSNVVSASLATNGKITITPTFDNTSCAAGSHWTDAPANWTNVINDVARFVQANYSANTDVTFKILYGYNCIQGQVPTGATSNILSNTYQYNSGATPYIRTTFQAIPNQNTFQSAVFGGLTPSDPTGSGNAYQATIAQGCIVSLDLVASDCNGTIQTGATGFQAGIWDGASTNGTAAPTGGLLQLWQGAHHETTEHLGRLSDVNPVTVNPYILDANSWSALNTHNITTTGSRYPSVNSGSSSVYGITHGFNQGASDKGDLDGTVVSAFNATGSSSIIGNPPLQGDFILMTTQGVGLNEKALTCAEDGGSACTGPF